MVILANIMKEQYFVANKIEDVRQKTEIFTTVIGDATYKKLR